LFLRGGRGWRLGYTRTQRYEVVESWGSQLFLVIEAHGMEEHASELRVLLVDGAVHMCQRQHPTPRKGSAQGYDPFSRIALRSYTATVDKSS